MLELMQFTENFDVVVVGAGHAGCEVEAFARRQSRAPKSRSLNGKRSAGRRGGT
jgi:succinate dehydrogenase/fumarate reductase flavoprotein subunit